jgi:hypothetical protein
MTSRVWWAIGIALAVAFCVSTAARTGPGFDEPGYLQAGLDRWHGLSSSTLQEQGVMPLPVDVGGGVAVLFGDGSWASSLLMARTGLLLFLTVLVWYGVRAAESLAGPAGGRLAAVMLVTEPVVLAHAGLVMHDVAVAACTMAVGWTYAAGRQSDWRRRVAWPGLWAGLAAVSKLSAIVLVPIVIAAVELSQRWQAQVASRATAPDHAVKDFPRRGIAATGIDILQIGTIAAVLMIGYWSLRWSSPPGLSRGLRAIAEAVAFQSRHNSYGHGVSILGLVDDGSFWFYFPLAASIKLSEFVLIGLAALVAARQWSRDNWPLWAAVMILLTSLFLRVQTGARVVMPALVLLIVGVAVGVVRWIESVGSRRGRLVGVALVSVGLAWNVLNLASTWPNTLCFTNASWGGTREGYRLLADSGYDWGQGLPELRAWQERHHRAGLTLWYWGTDPTLNDGPWDHVEFQRWDLRTEDDVSRALRGRYVAASTTLLYGGIFEGHRRASAGQARERETGRLVAAYLRSLTPVARTTMYLMYDFTGGT